MGGGRSTKVVAGCGVVGGNVCDGDGGGGRSRNRNKDGGG